MVGKPRRLRLSLIFLVFSLAVVLYSSINFLILLKTASFGSNAFTERLAQGQPAGMFIGVQDVAVCPFEPNQFIRGDVNWDGAIDEDDKSFIQSIIGGMRSYCDDAADVNDDGVVDMQDVSYLDAFLYQDGPAPKSPYPGCGGDATPDSLTCEKNVPACNVGVNESEAAGLVGSGVDGYNFCNLSDTCDAPNQCVQYIIVDKDAAEYVHWYKLTKPDASVCYSAGSSLRDIGIPFLVDLIPDESQTVGGVCRWPDPLYLSPKVFEELEAEQASGMGGVTGAALGVTGYAAAGSGPSTVLTDCPSTPPIINVILHLAESGTGIKCTKLRTGKGSCQFCSNILKADNNCGRRGDIYARGSYNLVFKNDIDVVAPVPGVRAGVKTKAAGWVAEKPDVKEVKGETCGCESDSTKDIQNLKCKWDKATDANSGSLGVPVGQSAYTIDKDTTCKACPKPACPKCKNCNVNLNTKAEYKFSAAYKYKIGRSESHSGTLSGKVNYDLGSKTVSVAYCFPTTTTTIRTTTSTTRTTVTTLKSSSSTVKTTLTTVTSVTATTLRTTTTLTSSTLKLATTST